LGVGRGLGLVAGLPVGLVGRAARGRAAGGGRRRGGRGRGGRQRGRGCGRRRRGGRRGRRQRLTPPAPRLAELGPQGGDVLSPGLDLAFDAGAHLFVFFHHAAEFRLKATIAAIEIHNCVN